MVEIKDSNGKVHHHPVHEPLGQLLHLGAAQLFGAITARISKGDKSRMMQGVMTSADCGSCHFPGGQAGSRIYLN